jgi:hypothetical protein
MNHQAAKFCNRTSQRKDTHPRKQSERVQIIGASAQFGSYSDPCYDGSRRNYLFE